VEIFMGFERIFFSPVSAVWVFIFLGYVAYKALSDKEVRQSAKQTVSNSVAKPGESMGVLIFWGLMALGWFFLLT
jgi:hypothetical protein